MRLMMLLMPVLLAAAVAGCSVRTERTTVEPSTSRTVSPPPNYEESLFPR